MEIKYFDTKTGMVLTALTLERRGLPADSTALAEFGIYPLRDEIPVHDAGIYAPIPDGQPGLEADGGYVQRYKIEKVGQTPEELFANAKADKLAEIMAGSNSMESVVKARYSKLEIDSWGVQRAQAETVSSGGVLAEDALLAVLAAANNVSVTDFAARVLANVAFAEAVTKEIVSQQQAYELRLKNAQTIDDVAAIVVAYTLPECAAR